MNRIPAIAEVAYPVMESFYTLQGEGFHQGRAAYFIRLGGCDVGCVWCDVKESWDASLYPKRTPESLIREVKQTPAPLVVITGGEPLLHDLTELTQQFKAAGLRATGTGSPSLQKNSKPPCRRSSARPMN